MNATRSSIGQCARCGTALCAAVAEGLCLRCLTRAIFFDDAELPPEEPLSAPGSVQRIGGYELVERIARGGMGVVYRARQMSLGREVALKILLDSAVAGPEELGRFRAEATAAAALHHPHIVAVHEIGEDAGRLFFSMDFVAGKDLAALTREGPLPARVAAELTRKIAGAIQHAHERGVLHRDLKPSNVLVDALGEPHVTDFGLSKRLVGAPAAPEALPAPAALAPPLTLTGHVVGTPGYMSPEQAAAKRDIGPPADVYSLGAVLYHLLTGRAPFVGETPTAVLRQVEEQDPVSPLLLNPSVPRDLETICHKCLAKEPPRRYASALELGQDLQRFLNGEPIHARPVGATERAWRWCRRRPTMAGLIALSSALLGAVIAVTIAARVRLDEDQRLVRRKDYVADLRLVERAVQENNLGQAGALLDKWRPRRQVRGPFGFTRAEEDLRGFEWNYLAELCRGDELRVLGESGAHALRVAFSSRGDRVAGATADGEVRLWAADTGRLLGIVRHGKRVMTLAFSPDDRVLATGGDDCHLSLWDAQTMQPTASPPPLNSALVAAAFARDRSCLIAVARQQGLVWDLARTTAIERVAITPSTWFYGVIAPNCGTVALPMPEAGGVELWDVPPKVRRGAVGGLGVAAAFSPDGRLLATGELSGQIRIWDLGDLHEVATISTRAGGVGALAWSPDAKRLASGGHDAFVRLWQFPECELAATYRGHRGFVCSLAFAPDGRRLASASTDGTVRLWDAEHGPAPRENPLVRDWGLLLPRGRMLPIRSLAVNSDTHWIDASQMRLVPIPLPAELRDSNTVVRVTDGGFLAIGPDACVRQFDRTGRSIAPAARLPRWPVFHPMPSPDGRWLIWKESPDEIAAYDLWEIASTNAAERLNERGSEWLIHAFSNDSRQLALITPAGELLVRDLHHRRHTRGVTSTHGTPTSLSFSRDDREVVASWQDGMVSVWTTGRWDKPPFTLLTGTEAVWCVCFSPDGRRVAGGGDDGDVFLWDVATRQLVAKLKAPGNAVVLGIGFTEDGDTLFASTPRSVSIWRARPAGLEARIPAGGD
ncbi:MAG TPA: protein kinase [Verrucomicrobiota bacterium]|nr:protein kinase [Verrucomicrobiota bacterium]